MDVSYLDIQEALADFLKACARLKEIGVTTNKKDFTSQLGEFVAAQYYDGKIADSSTQRFWDFKLRDGRKIQVKSHAKASTNKNQWTPVPYLVDADIDMFVIVIFTEDYKLKHFFEVSWTNLFAISTQDKARRLVRWNKLTGYDKIGIADFRNHELIKIFL